jgi:hypothetical protein
MGVGYGIDRQSIPMRRLATASLWTGIGLVWIFGLALTLLLDYMVWLLAVAALLWLTDGNLLAAIVGLPFALLPTALYVRLTIFGNRIPQG